MPEKPAYGDPKGKNGRLFLPKTGCTSDACSGPTLRGTRQGRIRSPNKARKLETGNTADPNQGQKSLPNRTIFLRSCDDL